MRHPCITLLTLAVALEITPAHTQNCNLGTRPYSKVETLLIGASYPANTYTKLQNTNKIIMLRTSIFPYGISEVDLTTGTRNVLTNSVLDGASNIAVSQFQPDFIYISRSAAHRITRYSRAGNVINSWIGSKNGQSGVTNGDGALAMFNNPEQMVTSTDGRILYVNDKSNYRIRRVLLDSARFTVDTVSGSTQSSFQPDGTGTNGQYQMVTALCMNPTGDFMYIGDYRTIRRLQMSNFHLTKYAGEAHLSGTTDGSRSVARFWPVIAALAITSDGRYLFVSDRSNFVIRRVDLVLERVSTLVGTVGDRTARHVDGVGTSALLGFVSAMIVSDDQGSLLIADNASPSKMRSIIINTANRINPEFICLCNAGLSHNIDGMCSCNAGTTGPIGGPCTLPCSANDYMNGTICTRCPNNSGSPASSIDITNCSCEAGWTGSDGAACTNCLGGTYKELTGSSACTTCPQNTFSPAASTALINCICDNGLSLDVDKVTCIQCPANTLAPGNFLGCTCNLGWTRNDSGYCTQCAPGTYNSRTILEVTIDRAGLNCRAFSAGTYTETGEMLNSAPAYVQLEGVARYLWKSGGFWVVSSGSAGSPNTGQLYWDYNPDVAVHSGVRESCAGGWVINNDIKVSSRIIGHICSACTANTYKSSVGNQACTNCPANSNSILGNTGCTCANDSFDTTTGTCVPCAPGMHASMDNVCIDCPAGTYKQSTGSSACFDCPANSLSLAASTIVTACTCNAGWTGNDGAACTNCLAGKYKQTTGGSVCEDCPAGSISPVASTVITTCTCSKGWTGNDGAACTNCAGGTYKELIGSSGCLDCLVNSFSPVASAGITSCTCNGGWAGNDGGPCVLACPANSYSGNTGCVTCPDNSFSPVASTAITACRCNAGWTGNNGAACTNCLVGTYKQATGNSVCQDCPIHSISPVASTAITACTCNGGWTGNDGGPCVPACLANSYSGNTGCVACPDNSFSPVVSTTITACRCNAGWTGDDGVACTNCLAGKYKQATGSSVCQDCPANSMSSVASTVITACTCNAGFIANDGAVCTPCLAGKYGRLTGSSICHDCPPNSISPVSSTVISACRCKAGWTGNDGAACTSCQENTYKSLSGNSSCISCPHNTSSSAASTALLNCICNNGLSLDVDRTTCIQCPANTLAPGSFLGCTCNLGWTDSGNGTCRQCAPGTFNSRLMLEVEIDGETAKCRKAVGGVYRETGQIYDSALVYAQFGSTVKYIWKRLTHWVVSPGLPGSVDADLQWLYNLDIAAYSTMNESCPGTWTVNNNIKISSRVVGHVCSACPANSFSTVASTVCTCNAGWTGSNGAVCTNCLAGTYKRVSGSSTCLRCPPSSSSLAASTACTCDVGWTRNDGDHRSGCKPCASSYGAGLLTSAFDGNGQAPDCVEFVR